MDKPEKLTKPQRVRLNVDMPLLFIEWEDHSSNHFWQADEDADTSPTICKSVGWLWKENDKVLILAASLATESIAPWGNSTTILKSCITKRVVLRGKKNVKAPEPE